MSTMKNSTETKATKSKANTAQTTEATQTSIATGTPDTGTGTKTKTATTTTPDTTSTETKTAKETTEAATGALALDYLAGGYYKGEGKQSYPNPDLVSKTAQTLAHDLAAGGLKQSTLNPILRDLKRANKKTLPLDAKHGALSGAIVQAKQLQQRKRAPGLLVEILERNRAAVQTDADYTAAVKHLTAVGVFLGEHQQ